MESLPVHTCFIIDASLSKVISTPETIDATIHYVSHPYNELPDILHLLIANVNSCYALVCIIPSDCYESIVTVLNTIDISDKNVYINYVCVGNLHQRFDAIEGLMAFYSDSITMDEFLYIAQRSQYNAHQHFEIKSLTRHYLHELEDTERDFEALINIGKALSIEKNPDKLLRLILHLSKTITGADAGSIYIVEEKEGNKLLRFKHSHTFSKELPYEEFSMPMDKCSIAGYVAVTQQVLNIPDVYQLGVDDPVSFNSSFDKAHGYRSKSMLVVPMVNHINQTIGVIQLINSKEDFNNDYKGNEAYSVKLISKDDFETKVVPFQKRYESLMEAVASQAAIAIENNRMIRQIQNQFEEFVRASVTAIESRDVATSGHSFRVADMCLKIANAINEDHDEAFASVTFTETQLKELEYAALLHDFGKVYIDTAIFLKSHKLYPKDLDNIVLKLEYLYRYQQLKYAMTIYQKLINDMDYEKWSHVIQSIEYERDMVLQKILNAKQKVIELNNPMVKEIDVEKEVESLYMMLHSLECYDIENKPMEIVTNDDIKNLKIKRGSLNEDERHEIESHVVHTYNFVSTIPWPPEFSQIPEIAIKHHEKLDGTGYPYGLKGDAIPLQARIMALADIFDALIATDRPYKPPITFNQALKIIEEEACNNKLDKELVALFINKKIYDQFDRDAYRIKAQ
ncbi:MAG TPA: HD domain-containing phosphohydrolase [Spirochaetota bacterium]|nr:HD domain-containing phosphohydrolase [Spirochaetota bacterium]